MGLLGGSFNPAHAGHRHVAMGFLRRLRLDQVWLLVSPGNPMKPAMAPLSGRLASARRIADGRRIVATDIEQRLHTRYTIDTLRTLRRRFPNVRFVWLTGADNFAELPHWRRWVEIVRAVPIAVHPRPGSDRAALAGIVAHRFGRARRHAATRLAVASPPAWLFLPLPWHPASATALRTAGLGVDTTHD